MTDGLRFQSGLGTNFTRRYKEGQQINTLLLAQVINVNYKYNTVDLMSLQHKEVFQNSYANEGKFSAKLPVEFGGRNIAGQPYGQIRPIVAGNIVLVGFINSDKNMPIVLSVYNDGTVSNKLAQAPFANADQTDEELQRHTYQKFQVYPSLTYDGIDGEGTRVASFSGKSFFIIDATSDKNSGTTDASYGTNYEDLATSYYNDGELIEPMVPLAPTILFNHQGIEDEDGNEDTHKLLFHIEKDGTYRTSMLDKTADWRTFFEMKPDGGVRLRRQGDSIRIDDGFEVGEIGITAEGNVYLRNGNTDLEVREDGLYSNGSPLSVDLSSIYEALEEQNGKLVSMSTQIIKTEEKVQIIADKTEYYDDKFIDYDASFTVMAEMIESKVTATEVQDMIDNTIIDFTNEIAEVKADADRANQVISDMANDNRVTPAEKVSLLNEWDLVKNEYPTYIAQAEVYEVSSANYTAKYNALKTFVEPLLADMTATSVVDGSLMRKTFGAYYTERTALLTAILKDLKDGLVEAMQKASQASIDSTQAKADASQAVIDANRANSLIADIASDGKLTASEKSQLKKEWEIVFKEYPTTITQAEKYEVDTADYTAKYNALKTFVDPLLEDITVTSIVEGEQLRTVFANYYDARVKLLRAISDSAKDDLLDYGQRIYVAETKITQTSEAISLLATKVETLEGDVRTNTAELKVQADLISQKVTASEVKDVVDNAINDMTIGTSNLYVIYTQTNGWLSETDGTVTTAVDGSVVSDYIKVKPSAPYVASLFDNAGSNTIVVAWYDSSKTFISGQAVAGTDEFSQAYRTPSDAVYARLSYKKASTVKIKFEAGTKPSDFSYSWADVKNDQALLQEYIDQVKEDADKAVADAEDAKNKADNANQVVSDLSNDNILTPSEKQQVLLQWEEIQAEYSKNVDQATKFGVSASLYTSAYTALDTYLKPILADLTVNSVIIGSTMRANFKTYYDRRTTLLNSIAERAKTLADNAQAVADKADSDLNNLGGYNYVGFSSGDNMYPRLMIDNVGYFQLFNSKGSFEGDKVVVAPNVAGTKDYWGYDVGTSTNSVPKNGLASYRLGDAEVGQWITASANIQAFGNEVQLSLYLYTDGQWTAFGSDPVKPSQGLKRVVAQGQIKAGTTAVLVRIMPVYPPGVTKFLFNKVQLEVGIRPTPWHKSDIDVQEDINNVADSLKDYVKSRGENLVTNGYGDLGDNTNIGGTFDGAERVVGKGSFTVQGNASNNFFQESIVVDANKVYVWEYYAKTLNGLGKSYGAILPLDVDGERIAYPHTGGRGYGSDAPVKFTKLTKPLKIGDTEIYVEDASLWNNSATVSNQRGVVLWGYKNSFGYQYEDGVYSRYSITGNWEAGAIDTTAKKITLNKPWAIAYKDSADGTFPVGHAISPTNEGATYLYPKEHSNVTLPKTFRKFTHYLSGSSSYEGITKFPSYVASLQLGYLLNREAEGGEKTWLNGISFKDCTDTYTIGMSVAWANKADGSDMIKEYPNENLLTGRLASATSQTLDITGWGNRKLSPPVPVKEGDVLWGQVYYESISAYQAGLRFYYMDKDGKSVGESATGNYIQPASSGLATINTTVPSGLNITQVELGLRHAKAETGNNTVTFKQGKVELGSRTIYTPSPKDDPAGAEMAYVGYATKDSDNYRDYIWSPNIKATTAQKRWANSPDGSEDFTGTYPRANLLIASASPSASKPVSVSGVTRSVSGEESFSGDVTKIAKVTGSTAEVYYRFMNTSAGNIAQSVLKEGKTYTFSLDLRANIPDGDRVVFRGQYATDGAWLGLDGWNGVTISGIDAVNWHRVSNSFTVPTGATKLYFSLQMFSGDKSYPDDGAYFEFRKAKLEEGTSDTIFITNPDDGDGRSVPKYIGTGVKNSNNPADFVWNLNSEFTTGELNGKEGAWIYSPTAPTNPAIGVVWVDSSVVPNQPKRWTGAENGWVALTPEEASDIPWGEDGSSLADWVAEAEQRISSDSIINTVLGSEDFTGIFDTKANTEDLTNLASYDDLANMQEEYQRLLKEGIDGIDFSPYVTNSELEQLKDSFNFTIQQAGGVNMLRNSLGFSGLDFWDGATSENLLLNSSVADRTVFSSNDGTKYPIVKTEMTEGNKKFVRIKRSNLTSNPTVLSLFTTMSFNLLSEEIRNTGAITVSFSARSQVASKWSFMAYYYYPQTDAPRKKDLEIGTTWKRYSITFDSIPSEAGAFRVNPQQVVMGSNIDMNNFYLDVCEYKVERGSTGTDWSPAPQDNIVYDPIVTTTQNADLSNLGFGSGFLIDHKDNAVLRQKLTLPEAKTGLYYAVSFYMNISSNNTGITAGIKIYEDGEQKYVVGHTDATKVSPDGYQRYYLIYEPSSVNTEIELFVTGGSTTNVIFSGIMYNIGNVALKWQPYPSEIYNTNVKIDINGITVKNNQTDGYTLITPQEFSGYARVDGEMERIFTLNGETTEVRMLKAEQRITMEPIAIFAMENSVNRGWAFVSASSK